MKILVCFEGRVRPDSTGFYLLNGFKTLGHEVTHVYPENILNIQQGSHDLYVRCDDGLKQLGWNKDLHPSHYYCIDTHIETDWRIELAKKGEFNTVSVVHSEGLKLNWGRHDIYWLPVGCDPDIHYVGPREKKYDGCFIGNFHGGLSGPRVEMLDTFFKEIKGPIFFGTRTFKEMTEKYAESKLVFNRSINDDVNMRVFETMCSGSCLVTDKVPDLYKLGFYANVHYVAYSNADDLKIAVNIFLNDPKWREDIAAAGRKKVLEYTYAKRMETLIKRINLNTQEKIECLR